MSKTKELRPDEKIGAIEKGVGLCLGYSTVTGKVSGSSSSAVRGDEGSVYTNQLHEQQAEHDPNFHGW